MVSGHFNEDRLLLLTAFRRAEEARVATVLASTYVWWEEKGEEVMEARASAFWRAAFLAAAPEYQCEGGAGEWLTGE